MSFFSDSQNVINGGLFIDNSVHAAHNLSGQSGIDTLLAASAPDASYDSFSRDPPPRCFPGTRERYIEDVTRCVLSGVPPLLWLKGPTGVGKSALAQTCVERLKSLNKPCAAFFFSVKGRRDPKCFFPSIAYQLSTIFPKYHTILDNIIRADRTLVDKSPRFQLQHLIIEPLRELHRAEAGFEERVPIFVDGLDECDGIEAQCSIIDLVSLASCEDVTQLSWAFFSRPEPHIEAAFSHVKLCCRLFLPISHEADNEIAIFLRNGFKNIRERSYTGLGPSWPSDHDLGIIVQAARGLFLYAAAVLRFVGNSTLHDPTDALTSVLEFILHSEDAARSSDANFKSPLAELDALYIFILSRIPAEIVLYVRLFLTLYCVSGLEVDVILWSNFLRVSRVGFRSICNQLNAVLCFKEDSDDLDAMVEQILRADPMDALSDFYSQICFHSIGGAIWFYHKSFVDFLMDPCRSGHFCATSSIMYESLYNHTIQLWLDYDSNISLPSSGWTLSSSPRFLTASPLSDSHSNPFINLFIIANIYHWFDVISTRLIDRGVLNVKTARTISNCDFRKGLNARSGRLLKDHIERVRYRSCDSHIINLGGIEILRILPNIFPNFDVAKFRKSIKRRQNAGLIRPYYSSPLSRFKALFHRLKSPSPIESGLYEVGRGEKGIIWYWEINHERKYYQSIQSPDLSDVTRVYKENKIEEWLKNWNEPVKRNPTS